MNTTLALSSALALCGWPGTQALADPPPAPLRHPEVYQRATREFAEADFLKPAEPNTNNLPFTLAPLILQEVNGAGVRPSPGAAGSEPSGTPKSREAPLLAEGAAPGDGRTPAARPERAPIDRFGTLSLSNGRLFLDHSRPAIYWQADTVQLKGKACARLSYLWCYSPSPGGSACGQSTNTISLGGAASALPLQGIRITLNSAGQPVIWEVLADRSGAELIFASQSLEAAALAEYGKPLPGRRYALEGRPEDAPNVVVARVIDDGPVPMGPIVYLRAGTREVSTLLCRCMPAQVKKLLATTTYALLPFQTASTNSLITQAKVLSKQQTAFWPPDHLTEQPLEHCLRLPDAGWKGW